MIGSDIDRGFDPARAGGALRAPRCRSALPVPAGAARRCAVAGRSPAG